MIRYLTKEDIPSYQRLITKVWQQTYPGIVNQEFLDNLSKTEQQRIELNKMLFNDSLKDTKVLEQANVKELVKSAINELIKLNYNDMVIGCISKNPANEFYKHIGGILSSQRPYTKTGDDLQENIYYFKDIKSLL